MADDSRSAVENGHTTDENALLRKKYETAVERNHILESGVVRLSARLSEAWSFLDDIKSGTGHEELSYTQMLEVLPGQVAWNGQAVKLLKEMDGVLAVAEGGKPDAEEMLELRRKIADLLRRA